MKPKASFVIPVYNGEAYLAETLDSVLHQTVKNIEIVVVNDASTDSTQEIIDYYTKKDDRIKAVLLPQNRGRCAARNEGINNALGEFILMLDADDLAYEERTKETIKFFKKNPTVDIVHTGFHVGDGWGNISIEMHGHDFTWDDVIKHKATGIGHSTMGFRREVFDKVRYEEENKDFSKLGIDDWKLQVDCHRAGFKFGVIKKFLGYYRITHFTREEEAITKLKDKVINA